MKRTIKDLESITPWVQGVHEVRIPESDTYSTCTYFSTSAKAFEFIRLNPTIAWMGTPANPPEKVLKIVLSGWVIEGDYAYKLDGDSQTDEELRAKTLSGLSSDQKRVLGL